MSLYYPSLPAHADPFKWHRQEISLHSLEGKALQNKERTAFFDTQKTACGTATKHFFRVVESEVSVEKVVDEDDFSYNSIPAKERRFINVRFVHRGRRLAKPYSLEDENEE